MLNTPFTDNTKQPLIVLLSAIISTIYLKKKWYEYLGVWLLSITIFVFAGFAFSNRASLFRDIDDFFKPPGEDQQELFKYDPNGFLKKIIEVLTPIFNKLVGSADFNQSYVRISSLIAVLVFSIFILIIASTIAFLDSSTALVRKKSKDKDEKPLIITDLQYLKQNINGKVNGAKIWQSFKSGFDALIVGFFALFLIVYGNQFLPIRLPTTVALGFMIVLLLVALVSSIVAVVYSGDTLRVKTRLESE